MIYIIENAYKKKLYEQLENSVSELQLISMAYIAKLDTNQRIIVDEIDFQAFESLHYNPLEVVVLTEKELQSMDKIRYVKKFQSIKNIMALVTHLTFPMIFLVFSAKKAENDALINNIAKNREIDMVISLDFNPDSNFSIFDSLVQLSKECINSVHLDVITHIEDYLNPPIDDLIILIKRLKDKKRLMIVSSPLKGTLDSVIMTLADTIILVDNDTMRLETHLKHRLSTKQFEVITYD